MKIFWVLVLRTIVVLACVFSADWVALRSAAAASFEWQTAAPESQGMSSQKLNALKDRLAANQTKAFLVARNDKIVCEWYAPGMSASKPHYTASMAKALVGGVSAAVVLSDGRITLDDKAARFVPQWRDDPRKSQITVRQLGSHASGIEDAEQDDIAHDKLTGWKGLFWKATAVPNDPFTVSRDKAPAVYEPGRESRYSNPGIAMLAYCLTAALKDAPQKDLRTLLHNRIMEPIGVPDDDWSVGYRKTFIVDGLPLVPAWGGGSYTARATARVGRLMLRRGNWDGQQLISEDAVRQVTSDVGTPGNGGIGWWSNNEGRCRQAPKDAFWGLGAGHQVLVVIPSLNLIAVRNGGTMKAESDWDGAFYGGLLVPLAETVTRQEAKSQDVPQSRQPAGSAGVQNPLEVWTSNDSISVLGPKNPQRLHGDRSKARTHGA